MADLVGKVGAFAFFLIFLHGRPMMTAGSSCPARGDEDCSDYPLLTGSKDWYERRLRSSYNFPNFHGLKESEPLEVEADGSLILNQVPAYDWGFWKDWVMCPKGTYFMQALGYSHQDRQQYLGVACQSPGLTETHIAQYSTPITAKIVSRLNLDWNSLCRGAAVQYWVEYNNPDRDHFRVVTANDVQLKCSTSVNHRPSLTGRSVGDRNEWLTCGKYQALCGFQPKLGSWYGKTYHYSEAITDIKMKCCQVPDPLQSCQPTETLIHVRDCDNTQNGEGLRCDFQSQIGLAFHHDSEAEHNSILFHASIGYDYEYYRETMPERILAKMQSDSEAGESQYYDSWGSPHCTLTMDETISRKVVCVKPYEKAEIFQIVAKCGSFVMRTNSFVIVRTDAAAGKTDEEYVTFG